MRPSKAPNKAISKMRALSLRRSAASRSTGGRSSVPERLGWVRLWLVQGQRVLISRSERPYIQARRRRQRRDHRAFSP